MSDVDWASLFPTICRPQPGADDETIRVAVAKLFAPITKAEVVEVYRFDKTPFRPGAPERETWQPADARGWVFPRRPFPKSYVSFIRWSNGGAFCNGKRFMRFLPIEGIRQKMIEHHVPNDLPGAVPFALDQGNGVYCFDMKELPSEGEYPILFASLAALSHNYTVRLADDLVSCCSFGHQPIDSLP